jgi:hypothetical protein
LDFTLSVLSGIESFVVFVGKFRCSFFITVFDWVFGEEGSFSDLFFFFLFISFFFDKVFDGFAVSLK